MLWGIDDETHEIVGTDYDLQTLKKGNQELENWLRSLLSKNADFEFHTVQMAEEKRVGVLIIYKATNQTVMFDKVDYIRVGSYTKRLSEYPAMQAQLWDKIRNSRFEERYAKQDLRLEDALRMLDYSVYFDNCGIIQPTDFAGVAHYMQQDEIVVRQDNGLYAITNLGAILFAKHLSEFPRLSRKAVRIVQYEGNNRLSMLKENIGNKGYAVGFEGLMKFVEALIPTQEPIVGALRENRSAYPILAIREAVANALIHQDFSISGTGPVIEIFEKRIEITNSGTPLVDVRRIIDNPPKSRNEKLASLMRRLRMCEELGSGWDKIVSSCEFAQLPAPKIELYEDSTRVVLFSEIPFSAISMEDMLPTSSFASSRDMTITVDVSTVRGISASSIPRTDLKKSYLFLLSRRSPRPSMDFDDPKYGTIFVQRDSGKYFRPFLSLSSTMYFPGVIRGVSPTEFTNPLKIHFNGLLFPVLPS